MTQQVGPVGNPNPFLGDWTYRSFINDPDISKDFHDLEFGRGELVIEDFAPGSFNGRLVFSDTYQFKLSGSSSLDHPPFSVRFQGVGDTADSQGQIYDYIGYLVPDLRQAARHALLALTPGAVNQDIPSLTYRRVQRPVFPLDPDMGDPDFEIALIH